MESKRQKQIGELVRRAISGIFQEEGRYIYGDTLVTVTQVMMSPDIGLAKIYLSIYNNENKQEVMLEIEEAMSRIKTSFAFRIKKFVRRIPNIHFYMDDTVDEMYRIDAMFNQLHIDNQMGDGREEEE